MTKLKIAAIAEDKPVTMTIKLPGTVHHDLIAGAARNVVGIRGAISSNVKLSDHAARSIG